MLGWVIQNPRSELDSYLSSFAFALPTIFNGNMFLIHNIGVELMEMEKGSHYSKDSVHYSLKEVGK